jgi:CubicO group peptidase (beta-lactamase class C family)
MRKPFYAAVLVLCTIATGKIAAQTPQVVFPGKSWKKASPEQLGWSPAKLEEARKYFETLPAGNAVVVDRGRIVAEWGDSSQRIKVSSVRKSLLSALYGIYVNKKRFDLSKTLEQLGIDDDPPLTAQEKQATLKMLLEARSGVYHPFVGGTPTMKAERGMGGPPRSGILGPHCFAEFAAVACGSPK